MRFSKWTDEQITLAVKSARCFKEVCRTLGCRDWGGSYYNIHKRIKNLNLDISHFDPLYFCRGKPSTKRQLASFYLVNNPNLEHREKGSILCRSLIEIERKYECEICKNEGFWLDKILKLEVDHIDGNWKNNEESNLRFLCPNCHAQTSNFGRKSKKPKSVDKRYGPRLHKRKVERPELQLLLKQTQELGFVATGKLYGVSDNAIRKWIKEAERDLAVQVKAEV